MSHANLNRRAIVAGAAALPALAVPVLASTVTSASACTLPPDLIERFVRVRAWYLGHNQRETLWSDEIDRRFYAATGFTSDQWRDFGHTDPRWEELEAARKKLYAEVPPYDDETECDQLCDERWEVAEAIIDHAPQTVADLAWQAEAYLIADLEILQHSPGDATSGRLIRTLFQHIRTLGALPQPDDPLGALRINISDSDDEVDEEKAVQS